MYLLKIDRSDVGGFVFVPDNRRGRVDCYASDNIII
jgi:hypothetical protein